MPHANHDTNSVMRLSGSIHPLWDEYTENQREQYKAADEFAKQIATYVLGRIQILPQPHKCNIYFHQFVLESVINILESKV